MNTEAITAPGRRERWLRRTAWFAWTVCLVLGIAGLVLMQVNLPNLGPVTFPGPYIALAMAVVYATVGLLIVVNLPGHGMGWLFILLAVSAALSLITQQYALFSVFGVEGALLPGTAIAAWMALWLQSMYFPAGIALPYLLFPDGRLPSRRWRPVGWLAVALIIAGTLFQMTDPGPVYFHLDIDAPLELPVKNPVGVDLGLFRIIGNQSWSLSLFVLIASICAPVARFRRAKGAEREQLKWFVFLVILMLLMFPLALIIGDVAGNIFIATSILFLPVGTAIAILRYHLYDIDVIIRKTLVYGVLTGVLALVYFGMVVVLQALVGLLAGDDSTLVIVISTLVIAALFTPLRGRVQTTIDRRFYRQKYNAEQVLARFTYSVRDETDLDTLTAELARIVEETMHPESVSVWVRPDRKGYGITRPRQLVY